MFYVESILSEVHSCLWSYNIYYQSCIHICVTVRVGSLTDMGVSEP